MALRLVLSFHDTPPFSSNFDYWHHFLVTVCVADCAQKRPKVSLRFGVHFPFEREEAKLDVGVVNR